IPPQAIVRTINVEEHDRDTQIRIPLGQRLPYRIGLLNRGALSDSDHRSIPFSLQIYGATSDTDWITNSVPQTISTVVDHVTCNQPGDYVVEVIAHLKNLQWGFWADYDDTTLVLHIKSAPHLAGDTNKPLQGLAICVDPGHGGKEPGAIGPSG